MKKTICILALILVFLTAVAAMVKPDDPAVPALSGAAESSLWEPVYGTRYYTLVLEKSPFGLRLDTSWEEPGPEEGQWILYRYTKEEVRYFAIR